MKSLSGSNRGADRFRLGAMDGLGHRGSADPRCAESIPLSRIFARRPDGNILAMRVVEEINRRLPNIHLVLNGVSPMPWDTQAAGDGPSHVRVDDMMRRFGVASRDAAGVVDHRCSTVGPLSRAARATDEFDTPKLKKMAMDALEKLCRDRLKQCGMSGNASRMVAPEDRDGEPPSNRQARPAKSRRKRSVKI